MASVKFNISGMTCVNCANAIEKSVKKINGVISSRVNFADSTGVFEIQDESLIKPIKEKIQKLGYKVANSYEELQSQKEAYLSNLKQKLIISIIISIAIMILEMGIENSIFKSTILLTLASVVIFYCGYHFFSHAMMALKNNNYDMNVLVMLGASTAYIYSLATFIPNFIPQNMKYFYFGGASMIITFVLLGRFLEEQAKMKANNYIKILMDLSPKTAFVVQKDGQTKEIQADNLKINDIVVVKSGYTIPCDGVIVSGGAEINTAMLTGESLPVYKTINDIVNAGTLNTNGYINVKVTKESQDTLLAGILDLLCDGTNAKMKITRFSDKVANIFVPTVVLIAAATFIVWLMFGHAFIGILSAICVLIISCPCALGLATPIAIIRAISMAAKSGIIIRNPEMMEIMHEVKFAIFDKTGTLTTGDFNVIKTNLNDDDLKTVCEVESLSEHPISKAISKFGSHLIQNKNYEFHNIAGMGINANDGKILIGNEKLMSKYGIEINLNQDILNEGKKGQSIVFVAINGKFKGYIILADLIRNEAKNTIAGLKELAITPVMLTGDNSYVADEIAKELGIKKVIANVLPEEKLKAVENLQKTAKVIFVGDGINDCLALNAADVAIAMNSGSDIAKNVGDVILISNNINAVLNLYKLSSNCMKTIKQNLIWAFIYNALCIPVATGMFYPLFGILLTPMYGAAAMSISSVSVVLNSLRMRIN